VIPSRSAALAAALLWSASAGAQSLLDRPPNLTGGWVGRSGTLYFNFLHRFDASPPPVRKVSNVPTFTLAAGLPRSTLVGVHYATNSALAPAYPNEWELWVRHRFLSQEGGSPLEVAGQAGYNLAADGVDGEVTLARRFGRSRATAVARILSDALEAGSTRLALGGGATVSLGPHLALAGDAATLLDRREGERLAWSAGIHLAIPLTPHTVSLHAASTNAYTLQGMSRGEDRVRFGFEFTVPVTLARWFGPRGAPAPAAAAPAETPPPPPAGEEGPVVRASMRDLAYTPARIEVRAGTTVEWTNDDALEHTVTSTAGAFDSGLLRPGARWRHTFSEPGEYPFACTPHPFMRGTVVVR
jgi:plastocyanin